MPVRLASWNQAFGVLPIFDMNLPEGALRERLSMRFAKAIGTFDDMDLLSVIGRSQMGRVRVTGMDGKPDRDVPFQSVDEILKARRGGDLYEYLIDKFAEYSGVSGAQPKTLVRDKQGGRTSQSLVGPTHIVKFWNPEEYPELAANEAFCLRVAKAAGLEVPDFALSADGDALVVERFDMADGRYLGFEDFCVLNGVGSVDKYRGSYEANLFKRARDFVAVDARRDTSTALFKLFVLNCAVRNGDAHMKNFGVLYDDPSGPVRLSPVFDVVTTCAYRPNDMMALTLCGSTRWPEKRKLVLAGQTRFDLSPQAIAATFEEVADAMADVLPEARAYFADSATPRVGERFVAAWEAGVRDMGFADGSLVRAAAPAP